MKRYLCSLVALGLLQGVTGLVKAQPTYAFTTLDVPGASAPLYDHHYRANGTMLRAKSWEDAITRMPLVSFSRGSC
jgi:hypothetical protein